ncbi:MAG: gluconate 2-dehydrogenase subunit 3 family protein [Bryobacteraceae bacterium]
MERRKLLKVAVAVPVLTTSMTGQSPSENVQLPTIIPDAVAQPNVDFFTREQFRALERLCEILVPSTETRPGAKEASVATFLDFLISESPLERQSLYRTGLDRLNAQARRDHRKPFASLNESEVAPLLKPLTLAWENDVSFLAVAKEDVLRATVNSQQFADASGGRASGTGYYWLPIE